MKIFYFFIFNFFLCALLWSVDVCSPNLIDGPGSGLCLARREIYSNVEKSYDKLNRTINDLNAKRVASGCRCSPIIPYSGTCRKICQRLDMWKKNKKFTKEILDNLNERYRNVIVLGEERRIHNKISIFRKNRKNLRTKEHLPLEERQDHVEKFKWPVVRR